MDSMYEKLKEAKSVLIAGGGIVGVEVASEIAVAYGNEKKIGICLRGDKLLPALPPRFGECATDFLTKHGVQIHSKTSYSESTTKELDYDFAIQCLGYTYKTDYMKKNFAACLAPNGQIYVNDLFQISSHNPMENSISEGIKDNIFAFGDVCITSLNEEKTVPAIKMLSDCITLNILQASRGQASSNQIPDRIPSLCLVSLGPDWGILQINGMFKY